MAHFVFMLTHGDRTVDDAAEIVPTLADTGLRYIGFKDVGADLARQREVTSRAHDAGFEVMLEVVSTTKEAELSSLQTAAEAGVDWVLGGTHGADTAGLLPDGVRYCPFPGQVVDHPSVLLGTIDEIADDAERLTGLDHVSGLDLLAYRHLTADTLELIRAVVQRSSGPVIVAGSIASIDRAVAVGEAGAWGYTIGSAIFDGLLPGAPSIADQVRRVLEETATAADATSETHT
jgi:tryptophan synthase alpha subunit